MNRRFISSTFVVTLTVTLLASGCAPGFRVEAEGDGLSPWRHTRVLVRNQHSTRLDIYLLNGQNRLWIGRVEPASEGYFELDAADLTEALRNGPPEVRLEVKPWGPQLAVQTRPVLVRRGRTIDWLIKPDLRLSRLRVY